MRGLPLITAATLLCGAAHAASPPAGVYGCYGVAPTMSMGRMSIQITPAPVMMFGLLDGTTYSDYDGKLGQYRFDGTILTMIDGSRAGWRYKMTAQWSFKALDQGGNDTPYTCPLEPSKDPRRRPW